MSNQNSNCLDQYAQQETTNPTIIFRSATAILSNFVPIYGVIHLGWNSAGLVVLFILEALIVLLSDTIKFQFIRKTKMQKTNITIEFVFIFFFGFFAILVYGPYESLENLISDKLHLLMKLIVVLLSLPLLTIAFFRFVRLFHDLLISGAFGGAKKQKLSFDGGAWMLLLFVWVMAAPIVARSSPNPFAGLLVIVLLKILGELFLVWTPRLKFLKSTKMRSGL